MEIVSRQRESTTDVSEAFDFLSHKLTIAKLNVYRFNLSALKVMQSYLTERRQRS